MIELARDGLLSVAPNRGFFVSTISAQEIRELYPLIAQLEISALREAPPTLTALTALEEANARFAVASDPASRQCLDMEWHELLIARCSNRTLRGLLDDLRVRVRRYELAYLRDVKRVPQSARQHAAIVRALRRGDPVNAERLLERNWCQGVDLLVPWAERREASA
jgi:DNA-binding GntR family transcriptional regulator